MWNTIMSILVIAIGAVVTWFEDLVSSMGAGSIILAGIGISLVVSLLLIPMRGGATSFVRSYTKNTISKSVKSNSKNTNRSKNTKRSK